MASNNIKYATLSGGQPLAERSRQIHLFTTTNDVEVFVVSIIAGGVGLNFTCADTVYIMVSCSPHIWLKSCSQWPIFPRMLFGIRLWSHKPWTACIVLDRPNQFMSST